MKKLLDVALVQQSGDYDCMIACLQMVLDYYNIPEDLQTIQRDLPSYNLYQSEQTITGNCLPQLGMYALTKGLQAEIITMHPKLFKRSDANKSQSELQEIIETYPISKENERVEQKAFLDFMAQGGKIDVRIPSADTIRVAIADNVPLVTLLSNNFLHDHVEAKRKINMHGNVIVGCDDTTITLHDPSRDFGGIHNYRLDEYIYASYAITMGGLDNGALLKIFKAPKQR